MEQCTHLDDCSLITYNLVWDCFPYNMFDRVWRSYRMLVALIDYAGLHPDTIELEFLREFRLDVNEDGRQALTFGQLKMLAGDWRVFAMLRKYCMELSVQVWSGDHRRAIDDLARELEILEVYLQH